MGLQFFVAVGLFTLGGVWLDRRLGTGVLFTLLGLALGFGGGFYAMYRDLYPRDRRPSNSRSEESRDGDTRG